MRGYSLLDDVLGFILGFFGGCCGLGFAFLLFRGEYVRGAVMGIVAQMGLTFLLSALAEFVVLSHSVDLATFRWEPFAMFAVCLVSSTTLIATGIWAFGGGEGAAPDEPRGHVDYVTFDRR